MSRRTVIRVAALLCGMMLGAPPLSALAASGGAAPMGRGTGSASSGSLAASAAAGTVSATSGGISLTTRAAGMLHNRVTFSGNIAHAPSGTVVEIERKGHQTGGLWKPTAQGTTDGRGNFVAVWPANHIGRFSVRAIPKLSAARAATTSPQLTVTVYRSSIATIYGPGFWGSRTACGEILHKNTIGVANRTLPCGTPVAVLYHGRTLVVPVIDRGPYANGADWDLTEAAAQALGIDGTVRLGAVSLPH